MRVALIQMLVTTDKQKWSAVPSPLLLRHSRKRGCCHRDSRTSLEEQQYALPARMLP